MNRNRCSMAMQDSSSSSITGTAKSSIRLAPGSIISTGEAGSGIDGVCILLIRCFLSAAAIVFFLEFGGEFGVLVGLPVQHRTVEDSCGFAVRNNFLLLLEFAVEKLDGDVVHSAVLDVPLVQLDARG
mmetsp:Transcript_32801/g.65004  ORF Transcript_32801/g.65004 Transcript_32801/m.65004 type:complete len:128 (+) Transcript_32801:116-499(+)